MKKQVLNRYEYPIHEGKLNYKGSYTIKEGIKPLGLKGEVLVQTFTITYVPKNERDEAYEK